MLSRSEIERRLAAYDQEPLIDPVEAGEIHALMTCSQLAEWLYWLMTDCRVCVYATGPEGVRCALPRGGKRPCDTVEAAVSAWLNAPVEGGGAGE